MGQLLYHYIENYSNIGKIGISYDAISEMVKVSIFDLEGIIITKSPTCELRDDFLNIGVYLKVKYGSNVNEISDEIQKRVINALVNMCEINNGKVNVKIEDIIVK